MREEGAMVEGLRKRRKQSKKGGSERPPLESLSTRRELVGREGKKEELLRCVVLKRRRGECHRRGLVFLGEREARSVHESINP